MKKVKADAETRANLEEMNPTWLKEKGGFVDFHFHLLKSSKM